MEKFFCRSCGALLAPEMAVCSACHTAVDLCAQETTRDMLINVLRDARAEVRSHAIFSLGRRRDKFAADALVACALRNPANVDEALQIVSALSIIDAGIPHKAALHYLIARHPSSIVKQAAICTLDPQ